MEKHIEALTREQLRQGVRITDVFNSGSATGEGVRIMPRIPLHRVKPTFLRDILFYAVAAWKLRGLRGERSLVIHVHGHWSAAIMARILAVWINAALVVLSVHGKVVPRLFRWRTALGAKMLIFATGLDEVRFLRKVTKREVYHLPSAPDERFFAPAPQVAPTCDIICVGNLHAVKNYPLLLNLANRMRDLRFAIYGDGPLRDALVARASDLGLTNVEWRGQVDIDTLRSALAGAGVLVNCSTEEGSPTSALEAMASGVPVIVTPANDYGSLFHNGEAGIVLKGWGLDELEAEVRALLNDVNRRNAVREAAYSIALRHRWEDKAAFVTERMLNALDVYL